MDEAAYYRERAEVERQAAAAAWLSSSRARHLYSAGIWDSMAERCEMIAAEERAREQAAAVKPQTSQKG